MQILFYQKKIKYDGVQITPHWALKKFKLAGDSIVAFTGPCDIPFKNMADLQDVLENSRIYSRMMLHFIIEHFGCPLELGICRQRIFAQIAKDALQEHTGTVFTRKGDDVYDGKYKVSISVAAPSVVSCKIHFGINIDARNAPVPAKGLEDYKIAPKPFASDIMECYAEELASITQAKCKVRIF